MLTSRLMGMPLLKAISAVSPHNEQGITGKSSDWEGEQGVDIELHKPLTKIERDVAERHQYLYQSGPVRGRPAAHAVQHCCSAQLFKHFHRGLLVDGWHSEADVAQGFGEDAAHPHEDHISELRIGADARDQLGDRLDLLGHQHALESNSSCGVFHLRVRAPDLSRRAQTKPDAPHLRLVSDVA